MAEQGPELGSCDSLTTGLCTVYTLFRDAFPAVAIMYTLFNFRGICALKSPLLKSTKKQGSVLMENWLGSVFLGVSRLLIYSPYLPGGPCLCEWQGFLLASRVPNSMLSAFWAYSLISYNYYFVWLVFLSSPFYRPGT